ncbi:MAG: L-2-hydroxyglutarate oxidase [Oligoflexia bacterium]|nr:L-2-hydroxyglutarate oxidase [Oligoflexia bacterium]
MKNKNYDFIIIGGGIMGLSIAYKLITDNPKLKIALIEKEKDVAFHSSGRNSGVLHAGFYYTADSLKAKFTKEGNQRLKEFCKEYRLKINNCGKIVIAKNDEELNGLDELKRRGNANNIELNFINEKEASEIDPNVKIHHKALFSPTTATVDPMEVCSTISQILKDRHVQLFFETEYIKRLDTSPAGIITNNGNYDGDVIINAAGLYADKIARDFGFSQEYTLLPFKGIYLKTMIPWPEIKTNIYPVPNLKNPFLGVHFTKTVNNHVKIGPTAIPAFWRENYNMLEKFKLGEMKEVLWYEAMLFFTNSFNFRDMAFDEMKKYYKNHLLTLAKHLVKNLTIEQFRCWGTPGIRAQLLKKSTLELVQDFVVEGGRDNHSIHILNAVSPAFTCSFPFSEWVIKNFVYQTNK